MPEVSAPAAQQNTEFRIVSQKKPRAGARRSIERSAGPAIAGMPAAETAVRPPPSSTANPSGPFTFPVTLPAGYSEGQRLNVTNHRTGKLLSVLIPDGVAAKAPTFFVSELKAGATQEAHIEVDPGSRHAILLLDRQVCLTVSSQAKPGDTLTARLPPLPGTDESAVTVRLHIRGQPSRQKDDAGEAVATFNPLATPPSALDMERTAGQRSQALLSVGGHPVPECQRVTGCPKAKANAPLAIAAPFNAFSTATTQGIQKASPLILNPANQIRGHVALIELGPPGTSPFDQILAAQNAGALAVIICSNDKMNPHAIPTCTTGAKRVAIPALFVSHYEGARMRALGAETPVDIKGAFEPRTSNRPD